MRAREADVSAAAGPQLGPSLNICAHIDEVTSAGHLVGWACLAHDTRQRVKVTVSSAEGQAASAIADLRRDDVAAAGYGDGRSGFSVTLPAALFDGHRHMLTVTFEALDADPLVTEITIDMLRKMANGEDQPNRRMPGGAGENEASIRRVLPTGGSPEAQPSELFSWPPPMPGNGGTNLSPPLYVPGHLVLCRAPSPLPRYHTSGWHEPEAGLLSEPSRQMNVVVLPKIHKIDPKLTRLAGSISVNESAVSGFHMRRGNIPARLAIDYRKLVFWFAAVILPWGAIIALGCWLINSFT
jgi:hypothetical protein